MAYENDYGNKGVRSELHFQLECNTASVKDPCNSTPLLIEILMFLVKGNDLFHLYMSLLLLLGEVLSYIVIDKLQFDFDTFPPFIVIRIKWIQFCFPLKCIL